MFESVNALEFLETTLKNSYEEFSAYSYNQTDNWLVVGRQRVSQETIPAFQYQKSKKKWK